MKIAKYLLVPALFMLTTSLSFASPDDSINLYIAPDPVTHCLQFGVDYAITETSTLGVMPASCANRPTFGAMNSQVTNKFRRILIPWRYSPHGAFKDGYFMDAAVGAERSEFRSAAGSTANVSFIDTAVHIGYQWFWRNGFNVSALAGIAHLMRNSADRNMSPAESATVVDFLSQQTSTTTHTGAGLLLGWAF